jgi:four helix bundle protein
MGKIVNFTDLDTWKESHKLALVIYKLVESFPAKETYILTSQILRAAISVSSNIAEGFSRRGRKEKLQFYCIALGSLTEIQNQLILAKDVKYIGLEQYNEALNQTIAVQKLIHGLIKGVKPYSSQYT